MILVLNIGLKNARSIIFEIGGKVVADFSSPVKTYINNNFVEQSPQDWWHLAKKVIKNSVDSLGKRKNQIKYITITTSASCLVVLDKNKKPLRNSILVSDTRSLKEVEELKSMKEFQLLKTKYSYKSSPDLMIPKILWIKNHEPDIFNRASYYLNISDYLNHLICGVIATDSHNATKFYYSDIEKEYPNKLLKKLDIDLDSLSKVRNQGDVIGEILPELSNNFQIPKNCKIILSTYDALAAVVGNGAFKKGDVVDVSGTVTSIRLVSDKKINDKKNRLYSVRHYNTNYWLHGGSNNLGGGVIEWTKQLFSMKETSAYKQIDDIINNTPVCPGGLLFLPYLLGDRTPFWNPNSRGVFFGLNRAHTSRDLIKAIAEGTGFSILMILNVFKELELPVKSMTVAGGLSRIDSINQIKSDMFNLQIFKYNNFETTAIGAAIIALVGIGEYSNIEVAFNSFCKIEKIYSPNSNKNKIYKEFSDLYFDLYNNLVNSFEKRAKLMTKLNSMNINELLIKENL